MWSDTGTRVSRVYKGLTMYPANNPHHTPAQILAIKLVHYSEDLHTSFSWIVKLTK